MDPARAASPAPIPRTTHHALSSAQVACASRRARAREVGRFRFRRRFGCGSPAPWPGVAHIAPASSPCGIPSHTPLAPALAATQTPPALAFLPHLTPSPHRPCCPHVACRTCSRDVRADPAHAVRPARTGSLNNLDTKDALLRAQGGQDHHEHRRALPGAAVPPWAPRRLHVAPGTVSNATIGTLVSPESLVAVKMLVGPLEAALGPSRYLRWFSPLGRTVHAPHCTPAQPLRVLRLGTASGDPKGP